MRGQDIYYAAVRINGKVFSVRIKADVRHDATTAYKDHKVAGIDDLADMEVTPAVYQGDLATLGYPDGSGPARSGARISLGRLVGSYKPATSKVVDDNGEPLVVYHGTRVQRGPLKDGRIAGDITAFDRLFSTNWRRPSIDTVGSWFSTNPSDGGAQMYSGKSEDSVIYPVYLSIQNPHTTTFQLMLRRARLLANGKDDGRMVGEAEVNAYRKWLEATGRDGIHILHDDGAENGSTEFLHQDAWIALEPTQIKSAIGNNGEFSPTNPDIRFSNRKNPTFFSQLGRAIETAKQDSMPGSQWRLWLQSNKAKLGVKDEEIAWTGLDEFSQRRVLML